MIKPRVRLFLAFLILFTEILAMSACALSNYIARINATPGGLLKPTIQPVASISTPSPEWTDTIAPVLPLPTTQIPTQNSTPIITLTPTPTPCVSGTVSRFEVPSTALGASLPVSIYLPPCYDLSGNYPVLYLLHGQLQTDQTWIDLGATTIADQAISNGQTPFIMVFPYEELNFENIDASKFPEALVQDLIPWVDDNFATCTDRTCRSIGGISRGGGWAIKLALRNFDLFSTLGAHSFGLMYGDANWVEVNLRTHTVDEFPRIYLDRGEQDMLADDIDYFANVLLGYGVAYEFHIYPGDHILSYWENHVQEYMSFYMASWPTPFPSP